MLLLGLAQLYAFAPRCVPVTASLFLDVEDEEEMLCLADSSRFITDPAFCYQEFARRDEDHLQVLRVQVRTDVGKREWLGAWIRKQTGRLQRRSARRICLIDDSVLLGLYVTYQHELLQNFELGSKILIEL